MFDTQQQETYRTTPGWKQEIKTDFLPCHSASSVSKHCSLHLNLIRIFLGIHYPYLLLVSPYQQMPAYLYWDPDKICATPVILESSPTSSEQKSLMWLDIIQISRSTLLLKTAMPVRELPSQQQRLLENGRSLKSHIFLTILCSMLDGSLQQSPSDLTTAEVSIPLLHRLPL